MRSNKAKRDEAIEDQLAAEEMPPIIAESAACGLVGCEEVLRRPLSFHFMNHGVYENRRNRAEAEYIAQMVAGVLKSGEKLACCEGKSSHARREPTLRHRYSLPF